MCGHTVKSVTALEQSKTELLESLCSYAESKSVKAAPEGVDLPAVLRAFYRHVAPEDLLERDTTDLYGAVMAQLRLAAERTAGAHPYLTTPEHTRRAREILGYGVLLAPEQKVVVDPDPERARASARPMVSHYLGLRNYVSNLRRLGWTDTDFADGGSDALIDQLAVHGDAATVVRGVRAHLDAGADHVCVQVLPHEGDLLAGYRAIAEAAGLIDKGVNG